MDHVQEETRYLEDLRQISFRLKEKVLSPCKSDPNFTPDLNEFDDSFVAEVSFKVAEVFDFSQGNVELYSVVETIGEALQLVEHHRQLSRTTQHSSSLDSSSCDQPTSMTSTQFPEAAICTAMNELSVSSEVPKHAIIQLKDNDSFGMYMYIYQNDDFFLK